eukprot:scaffold8105_cov112-Isochrysis_galbana.AAC.4
MRSAPSGRADRHPPCADRVAGSGHSAGGARVAVWRAAQLHHALICGLGPISRYYIKRKARSSQAQGVGGGGHPCGGAHRRGRSRGGAYIGVVIVSPPRNPLPSRVPHMRSTIFTERLA